jgi:hypothetical protein
MLSFWTVPALPTWTLCHPHATSKLPGDSPMIFLSNQMR